MEDMILLNKIPVLDKGFVAKFDSSCDGAKLNELAVEYFKRPDGRFLTEMSSLTLLIKCPLFVQLNFSTFGLRVTNLPSSEELEAYLPNVGEIGSPSLEAARDISEDIARTTAALLMNPKAYQADGCDRFISQTLTPVSAYTTILVYGMYNDWCRFVAQNNAPQCLSAYTDAINQIMRAEWR
jgi:hypothetical protein